MTRLSAKDFDPELLELYDYYAHGYINKREFLARAGKFAVGGLVATSLLGMLSPNYALAEQVKESDSAIKTEMLKYASAKGNGNVNAYMAKPATMNGPRPAVLVIHENRGLNPYVKDVARRLAKAGFIAMAPDGLSSVGGYPGNDEEGKALQKTVDKEKLLNDFFAGFEYLLGHKECTGKVGAVGFCYGGGVCNALAVAYPELAASVPYYGRHAAVKDVPRIKAPLMLHFGELDKRINQGWPEYEAALKTNSKNYVAHIYKEANHGFHNDTTPRFDKSAAELSWQRSLDFFVEHLELKA